MELVNSTKLCDWGCGKVATHYFTYSKKYCCGSNVSKCPEKKRKQDEKMKESGAYKKRAEKSHNTMKNIISSNGKTIQENATNKMKKTVTAVDGNGETIAKKRSTVMVDTRRKTIDPTTGLDQCKLSGLKQKETKNRIDEESGFTIHKISGMKGAATKKIKDKNGQDWYDRVRPGLVIKATKNSRLLHEKRLADIDEHGLDHYARRTQRMLEDIDETGLNGIERAHIHRRRSGIKKNFKDTHLYYQCSYELAWLEKLEQNFGLLWVIANVKNGKNLKYYNPVKKAIRFYMPDFTIGNTLYEIKSSYTWNNHGIDSDTQSINESKLSAAKKLGYAVILVLDGIEIPI